VYSSRTTALPGAVSSFKEILPVIARQKPIRRQASVPDWHHQFLAMLPVIRKYANHAFQYRDSEAREDAVHEVIANAVVAFARLVQLDKADLAYPTVLARYGVAQLRGGRRVGNRRRVSEVLAEYAQRKKGFVVESLDCFHKESGQWLEALVEDTRTPVPDQVAFRIDFPAWLNSQTKRNRRIAEALAVGSTTGEVARRFKLSSGRISQLRNQFHQSWREFQGDTAVLQPDFAQLRHTHPKMPSFQREANPHNPS
jgi:hypothetical protein